jgi:hypothetical protein
MKYISKLVTILLYVVVKSIKSHFVEYVLLSLFPRRNKFSNRVFHQRKIYLNRVRTSWPPLLNYVFSLLHSISTHLFNVITSYLTAQPIEVVIFLVFICKHVRDETGNINSSFFINMSI